MPLDLNDENKEAWVFALHALKRRSDLPGDVLQAMACLLHRNASLRSKFMSIFDDQPKLPEKISEIAVVSMESRSTGGPEQDILENHPQFYATLLTSRCTSSFKFLLESALMPILFGMLRMGCHVSTTQVAFRSSQFNESVHVS